MIWIISTLPSSASALQNSLSALEREIASLESRSSSLEPLLGWFTLLVAIGVALEVFVIVHDHKKEANEWRVCELIPEGPSLIKLGVEIASIVLVIVGVMGEFGVGLRISSINGQLRAKGAELRSKSDQLLNLVTQQTGEANERASKNEKDAATLTAKNLQLEAMIAPRRLSSSQLKELSSLAAFAGRIVQIKSYAMDTEGLILATQIAEALTKSKVVILDNRLTIIPGGQVIAGVVVEGQDSALAAKLKKVLAANGGELNTGLPNSMRGGFSANIQFGAIAGGANPAATVTVGVKPIKEMIR